MCCGALLSVLQGWEQVVNLTPNNKARLFEYIGGEEMHQGESVL